MLNDQLREHPFNFKGHLSSGWGGAMFFWEKKISVGKFDLKKILSLKWAGNNILLALKKILFL